ncbi:UDP-N-acetylglucosamine 4,6-dehydratase (inverting) [Candidatus Pelagibacter sp.]|jgi:UDP-N-acetylglucosamine 4,6-dehydratase/5-epimerase|nr:UDP-N-acetylglucosamine 4,6-dehydratase (inverting) [Candidatus Pelagibacter sp.]
MENNSLKGKCILITGGTGSFGNALIEYLFKLKAKPRRVVVFSRDELKQFEMQKKYSSKNYLNLRFFLGDVRDKERLRSALKGVDVVIHAAALKQVPTAEYNPIEYIKTNILGAQNIIEECIDSNVSRVIALSTDKASSPVNLYGATKLCSDKLFVSANNIKGKKNIRFSVVRYGNVFGSRGSVAPIFSKIKKKGTYFITDPDMTRFNITLKKSIEMVLWTIKNMEGGEIFVPKIPSYNIMQLVKAFNPNAKVKNIGIRAGEKLHEEMISINEAINTVELKEYYAILNGYSKLKPKYKKIKYVKNGFYYNSNKNSNFLNIKELQKLIKSELK